MTESPFESMGSMRPEPMRLRRVPRGTDVAQELQSNTFEVTMKHVGIIYATKEGHALKVAQHVGVALQARMLDVEVHDVKDPGADELLIRSDAVVLIGSVHLGKHEPGLVAFVKAHRKELDGMPAAFLSVCGAEAGAEQGATPEMRAKSAAQVGEQLEAFMHATGWHPRHVRPVAGAIVFTHYNPLVRWVMKQVAKGQGLPTDTTRDYDFTDWVALDAFCRSLADELHAP
jgi:menaquinone-dependent protoporphyrinogen oxidase